MCWRRHHQYDQVLMWVTACGGATAQVFGFIDGTCAELAEVR